MLADLPKSQNIYLFFLIIKTRAMTQIMQNTRYSEMYAYVRAMQEKKNVGWWWWGGGDVGAETAVTPP